MSATYHMHPRSTALRDRACVCISAAVAAMLVVAPALAREGAPPPDLAALPGVSDVDDVRGEPHMSASTFGPARDFRILIEIDHAPQSR
jgi:hypothetical protein